MNLDAKGKHYETQYRKCRFDRLQLEMSEETAQQYAKEKKIECEKQATLIEKLYIFLDTSREGFNTDELEGLLIEINEL